MSFRRRFRRHLRDGSWMFTGDRPPIKSGQATGALDGGARRGGSRGEREPFHFYSPNALHKRAIRNVHVTWPAPCAVFLSEQSCSHGSSARRGAARHGASHIVEWRQPITGPLTLISSGLTGTVISKEFADTPRGEIPERVEY